MPKTPAAPEKPAPATPARGWLPSWGASAPAAQTAPALVETAAATEAPVQTPTTQARGWLPSWGATSTPAQATVPTTDQAAPPAAAAAEAPNWIQALYSRASDTVSGAAGVASSGASGLMSTASGLVLSAYEYWLNYWYGKLNATEANISVAQKKFDSLAPKVEAGDPEAIATSELLRKEILVLEGEINEATSKIAELQAKQASGSGAAAEEVASSASDLGSVAANQVPSLDDAMATAPMTPYARMLVELGKRHTKVAAATTEGEGTSHVAAPLAATEANPVAAPERVMPREYVAAHSQQTDAVAAALAVLQGAAVPLETSDSEHAPDTTTIGDSAAQHPA